MECVPIHGVRVRGWTGHMLAPQGGIFYLNSFLLENSSGLVYAYGKYIKYFNSSTNDTKSKLGCQKTKNTT